VTGDVRDLEVPETLHALVASRLDGLSPAERSMLQDASVLGQSFTAAGVAALSDRPEGEVVEMLERLVIKQVLSRDDDPRSPETGQYVFLQALLRSVAYGTLSRRNRKALHLAAARYLKHTWPGEAADIAEVLASHYLEAIRADPESQDVDALRASAGELLTAAGRAAASLALGHEAQRYFEQAAELAEGSFERAGLFEQAGRALRAGGDPEAAQQQLLRAIDLYHQAGVPSGGSAAVALAHQIVRSDGDLEAARTLLDPFRSGDDLNVDTIVRAQALAELAAVRMFAGEVEEAGPLIEEALTTLEQHQAGAELVEGMIVRGIYLMLGHRLQESAAVLGRAVSLADKCDLPAVGLRARFNLAAVAIESDDFAEAVREVDDALALARERGDRVWERMLLVQSLAPLTTLGRWDHAATAASRVIADESGLNAVLAASFLAHIAAARGDDGTLDRCCSLAAPHRNSTHVDMASAVALTLSQAALDHGTTAEALALARTALDKDTAPAEVIEEAYAVGIEAAIALGDKAAIDELEAFVASLPPARATPLLRAGRARLLAEQAHRRGDAEGADRSELEAIDLLRMVGARPLLAKALLDRAGRRDDPDALNEARSIYAELGATRWLERIERNSELAAVSGTLSDIS
jgi:tetratricopeptide (TPR) repeat protein